MASISSISNSTNYQVARAQSAYEPQRKPEEDRAAKVAPPPPPPGDPRGENTGLQDSTKLKRVSELLDMDTSDVTSAATSASSLVSLLQDKSVDFTQLRDVLNRRGDLLDVSA